MASVLRNVDPLCSVIRDSINSLKLQIGAGALFHLDRSEMTVTAANASDLATSLTLCNELVAVARFHFADTLAHKVADPASLPALGAAVDLATAMVAANLVKASYGTHIGSTTFNYNADATNTIAAANASDQTSLNALLNELKTDLNAHMASGPSGASVRLVSA